MNKYKCKCGKSFKNSGSFAMHKKYCKFTLEQLNEVRQLYNSGMLRKQLLEKGYDEQLLTFALRGCRRSRKDSAKLVHKIYPESFKPTQETKDKISKSQRLYYEKHPDKLPYLQRHSSNKSILEDVFEQALISNKIFGWVRKYRNGLYEYDFAFPILKIDVEIDGHTHNIDSVIIKDKRRDEWSKNNGWKVIRFSANYVRKDVQVCIQQLINFLKNENYDFENEINKSFLFLRKVKDRKKEIKQQQLLIKEKKYQELVQNRIKQARHYDKSSYGRIGKLAKLWNISHTQVRRFLQKYNLY